MQVELQIGEELIIKEGKTGWGKTLAVTTKRLLILDEEKIIGETPLEDIAEALVETQMLTDLTQLRIKLKNGREMPVIFRNRENGRLYDSSSYSKKEILKLTNKYAKSINRAIREQISTPEL